VAEGGAGVIGELSIPLSFLGAFGDAFDFIVNGHTGRFGGGTEVGGPDQVLDLAATQLEVTGLAMALALAVALPAGLVLGHYGKGELLAVAVGNAGRAIPELAIIAFMATAIGVGLLNVTIALAILAVPPILTNTFVAVRQVDRGAVQAAQGMGMTAAGVVGRVELPLAVPTIMSGVRTSTINVVATATIAPLAGVLTLGDFIINQNVYGDDGVLAGAICVAILTLALELLLAGVQRLLTPRGLRLARARTA
jgi:osmoprotectant transport system permease protein